MKKLILISLFSLPIVFGSCGGDKSEEKEEKKAGMTKEDQCECLHASLNDRSKECHKWRAQVMKDIKGSLGDKADDLDAIDAELEKLKSDCE